MKKLPTLLIFLFAVNGAMSQWELQNSGTAVGLRSVYFTSADTGCSVGEGGTILKTLNGGLLWTNIVSGTSRNLNSVHFPDSYIGYAVGDNGTIIKTIDGGINWTPQASGVSDELNSVHFTNANKGYAVGSGGEILRTLNGGTDWTAQTLGIGYPFLSVYFPETLTGYAVGHQIFKTTDGGANWTLQQDWNYGWGDDGQLNSVYFKDINSGNIVGESRPNPFNGLVLSTENGGSEWLEWSEMYTSFHSIYFPDIYTGYIVGDAGTGGYVDEGGIILKKTDDTFWTIQSIGTFQHLKSVYFTDADTGYVVGDSGTIIKTNNGGGYPLRVNNHQRDSKSFLIFPNPTTSIINVETLKQGRLSILDLNGRELLQQELSGPGIILDTSTLSPGVYFIKLINGKTVEVGKLIKN